MDDCMWMFGDHIKTEFSRVFFVNKKLSSWHQRERMISTGASNEAGLVKNWTRSGLILDKTGLKLG